MNHNNCRTSNSPCGHVDNNNVIENDYKNRVIIDAPSGITTSMHCCWQIHWPRKCRMNNMNVCPIGFDFTHSTNHAVLTWGLRRSSGGILQSVSWPLWLGDNTKCDENIMTIWTDRGTNGQAGWMQSNLIGTCAHGVVCLVTRNNDGGVDPEIIK